MERFECQSSTPDQQERRFLRCMEGRPLTTCWLMKDGAMRVYIANSLVLIYELSFLRQLMFHIQGCPVVSRGEHLGYAPYQGYQQHPFFRECASQHTIQGYDHVPVLGDFAKVFVDDILISSSTMEELVEHVGRVLVCLNSAMG